LHAHYAAIVQAHRSKRLPFRPVLADFEQVTVIVGYADARLGCAERGFQLVGCRADLDSGNLFDRRFFDYRNYRLDN
jgi:hypothetical protein